MEPILATRCIGRHLTHGVGVVLFGIVVVRTRSGGKVRFGNDRCWKSSTTSHSLFFVICGDFSVKAFSWRLSMVSAAGCWLSALVRGVASLKHKEVIEAAGVAVGRDILFAATRPTLDY